MKFYNIIILILLNSVLFCKPEVERNPLQFSGFFELLFSRQSQDPSLAFSGSPYILTLGIPINTITPLISEPASSCTANPSLPIGLSIDPQNCSISGTPTANQTATSYIITAIFSNKTLTAEIWITVNEVAPTALNYSGSPFTFSQGLAITNISPTYTGTITSCSSSPALPIGLVLSATCGISGTPTTIQVSSAYTITASNTIGNTLSTILITINTSAPTVLNYSGSPFTFTQNDPLTTITPTYTGTITSCSSIPTLPSSLVLSTTCGISGTPITVQSSSAYTITATNTYGSTSSTISIAILIAPPSGLSYTGNPFTFTKDVSITAISPSLTGTATSWSVIPSLPLGLSINSSTGVLAGTPNVLVVSSIHSVTATNSTGFTSFNLTITVNDAPPSLLNYAGAPFVFTKGVPITSVTPTIVGTPTSYSVSPALPTGLAINTTSGVLAGNSSVVAANITYTVTATNSGGSTTFAMGLRVNDTAPTTLNYAGNPYTFSTGMPIASVTPTVSGTPVSYSVSPALPSGLSINSATGVLSGNPTAITASGNYIVTATNTGGNTTFTMTILVLPSMPSPITVPTTLPYTTFSIAPVGGATGYAWSVPPFATITSGQGTTSITVSYSGTCGSMGNISVVANSAVGNSPPRVLHYILNQVLKNASAEQGNLSDWTIVQENGSGWAGGVAKGIGFATSYSFGVKSQKIDLLAAGFLASYLDTSPTILVGEKFGNPPSGMDGFGKSYIKVELRDSADLPLATWNIGTFGTGITIINAWSTTTIFQNQFNGYLSGVRYLYWEDGGWDNPRFWSGYYGPGLSQAYVVIGSACVAPY